MKLICLVVFAGQTHEGDVLDAAGHDEAAGSEVALAFLLQPCNLRLEADGLAVVLLRLLGDVAVKERIVVVLDLDHGRVEIKGQGILNFVVLRGAVSVFVENSDAAVQGAGQLVQGHDVLPLLQTVEHDHFAAGELIDNQRTHIGVIGHDRAAVGKHDLLCDLPVLRHVVIEGTDLLHAVELDDDTLGVVLFQKRCKLGGRDGVLILNDLRIDVLIGIGGDVVFLLAFFADQKQRAFAGVEALVTERFLNEFCLSGVQKTGKGIDGNGHKNAS